MNGSRAPDQGAIFSLPVANPGAGIPLDIIATNSQVWRLWGILLLFTTDATVVTRQLYLEWFNGINSGARLWSTVVQAASLARSYDFLSWYTGQPVAVLSHTQLPFGGGALIDGAEYLRISADNLQAGDTFTGIIVSGERWLSD